MVKWVRVEWYSGGSNPATSVREQASCELATSYSRLCSHTDTASHSVNWSDTCMMATMKSPGFSHFYELKETPIESGNIKDSAKGEPQSQTDAH